jgi:hypothetical protein
VERSTAALAVFNMCARRGHCVRHCESCARRDVCLRRCAEDPAQVCVYALGCVPLAYIYLDMMRLQVHRLVAAGAVPALKKMLESGAAEDMDGPQIAANALGRMCAVPEGRDAAVAVGVPEALEKAFATASPGARSAIALAASNMCVVGLSPRMCASAMSVPCVMRATYAARGSCRCENAAYVRVPCMRAPVLCVPAPVQVAGG